MRLDGRKRKRKKKNQRPAAEEKSSRDDWKLPLMVCMQEPGRGAAASALAPGDALMLPIRCRPAISLLIPADHRLQRRAFVIVSGQEASAALRLGCWVVLGWVLLRLCCSTALRLSPRVL